MSKSSKRMEIRGSVWMTVGGENFGGSGRVALLSLIAETGSITQAAKSMKMSYKAAWDAIDAMNSLAGAPLVERVAGGKGGGGTKLTLRGQQLVRNFRVVEREHERFMNDIMCQADGLQDDLVLIRMMSMKTSARNQFHGRIVSIKGGAVNDEVVLETAAGQKIVAIITRESTLNLGLKEGMDAFVLVKASSIILVADDIGDKLSASNALRGRIARVQPGAVNTEVVIELQNSGTVAAIITNESYKRLGLDIDREATAVFKASSVILGVIS